MSKKTTIGGQALIEGILMRGPSRSVMAVRRPDGSIVCEDVPGATTVKAVAKIPVIRGVFNFILSLKAGYKALMRSADLSGMTDLEDAEEEAKAAEKRAKKAHKAALKAGKSEEEAAAAAEEARAAVPEKKDDSALMNIVMVIGSVLGVALAMFLFLYLPALLFDTVNGWTGGAIKPFKTLIEGVLKILVFLVYLILVSRMKDIRRVFQYHGAEHKTIFCYESGEPLTVENARRCQRFHPRCGTSFLIIMLVVGILVSFLLVTLFPALTSPRLRLVWIAIKLLMVPVICGLSYELIKICGRHDNALTRAISAPGMWMQRLTTAEPEDGMLEVAITALTAVIPEDPAEDDWT